MLALGLFLLGLFLTISPLFVLVTKMFIAYVTVKCFCANKADKFSVKFRGYLYGIFLTIGISLIYIFAESAKTFVLLNLL